jgi:release factor glutamine methyltransferase
VVRAWLIEARLGWTPAQQLLHRETIISAADWTVLEADLQKLQAGMPIQYVLGRAPFLDFELAVNPACLIPRPETEELADFIIRNYREQDQAPQTILDVGTGSGCLAIALKRAFPGAVVHAVDVRADTLDVAQRNAAALTSGITFQKMDFLDREQWSSLASFDLIVSNPPYIARHEAAAMEKRVLDYEPDTALFVPDHDPLVFYRHLFEFSKDHLLPNGSLWCETSAFQKEALQNLEGAHSVLNMQLMNDLQHKFRFIHLQINS